MITSTIIYLSPILDIKLDPRTKARLMEYLVEEVGYQEGNGFRKIGIGDYDDIYAKWKDKGTLVLTDNIMTQTNLEYCPRYEW